MPAKRLICAAHGFLGQARDWAVIEKSFQASESTDFKAVDFFSPLSPPIETLEIYLKHNNFLLPTNDYSKKIFIGYSLGGRIGLHILKWSPELFDHYIFLSTNPGLPEDAVDERQQRLKYDDLWAQQLTQENWTSFLAQWNSQKIFDTSSAEPTRKLADYDLVKLQQALQLWSLGWQENMSEVIRNHQAKITWVVGEKDFKYLQIAEDLKQKKILLDYKRISSGHRIGLEQPEAIIQLLRGY